MSAPRTAGWWLAVAGGIVAVAAVIAAVVMTGTPAAAREARLDGRRIDDLQRLQSALYEYVRRTGALPPNLAVLAEAPGNADLPLADPVTKAPYEYIREGKKTYRLCANFTTDSATSSSVKWEPERWRHGAGRHCYPLGKLKSTASELLDLGPVRDDGP